MADPKITAAVGILPAANRQADVRIVQNLLAKVTPPLSVRVQETGVMDAVTLRAIHEFQKRFMTHPDSRVDPDGRTLWHLGEGFVAKYIHCNSTQRKTLDRDLMTAQIWLDRANGRLGALDDDARTKIKNIFHIDAADRMQPLRLPLLRLAFAKLRISLNDDFPLECEPRPSINGAWVELTDPTGTMHFPSNHFNSPAPERVTRLIHERSHTVFQIHHDGMPPGGALNFGQAADDDNGFTYEQAVANAYCYGWLAAALQPDYHPVTDGMVITGRPRR
ncbi:MAG: hypothetical protein WBE38_03445 [Terracidiphilus sp.]|jgi:hypothetical protein